jgi:hypothetical protein
MIDRRSKLGKMIDGNKVVYQCTVCNRKFIGDRNTNISKCSCSHDGNIVIVENMVVTKGV